MAYSPAPTKKKLSRAERIIGFAEKYLKVPEGALVGQPIRLDEFQKKFIRDVYDNPTRSTRRAILSMARKNAKALSLDTPIPTPNGWRTMADILEGDFVYGSDGKPCKVIGVSEVFKDKNCYKVGFSDGSEIIASEDHLWTTTHKFRPWDKVAVYSGGKKRGRHGFNRGPVTAVVTTKQIKDSLLVKRNDGKKENNHSVQVAKAVTGAPHKFSINPYLLGCWLGDGTSASSNITSSTFDLEHFISIFSRYEKNVSFKNMKGNTVKITFCSEIGSGRKINSFQARLRKLGLIGNKHIPDLYLEADEETRWLLLQGLMDTDGCVNRNGGKSPRASFCNKNKKLIDDVWSLCRSLGIKAKIRSEFNKKYQQTYYHVNFSASKDMPIFMLERKQSLLPDNLAKRSKTIKIVSCEPVGKVPCKCIAVDSRDHLFLCGRGYIPTHNTTLIAILLLAHLVGPEAKLNTQIVSGAQSRDQAALVFDLACKMIRQSKELSAIIKIIPSSKKLMGLQMGTEYKALSAEGRTAHGLSPILAILDETGQVVGPKDDFIDAIMTSQGAHENPLLIVISTQAANDADLLSVMIDDAIASKDPAVVCHLYAAPEGCDLMDEEAWKAANPALGLFRSLDDLRQQMIEASRMPSKEASARNLLLNQRVSTKNPLISKSVWKGCSGEPVPIEECDEVYAGLDLSGRTDRTAFVLYGLKDGLQHVRPIFWTPEKGLHERSKRDRAPYDVWSKQGLIFEVPGATIDYGFVATQIAEICAEIPNLVGVAYDRWRIELLQKELQLLGASLPLIEWGQGFKDMSPAIEALEDDLLNATMRHGDHPVLTMCAANAMVTQDPAGNRKLDKMKTSGRIDGIVALAMAAGLARRQHEEEGDLDSFLASPIIG